MNELELQLEEAKLQASKRDSLLKLYKNKQFKEIILEGYFKEEPAKLAIARPNIMSTEQVHVDDAFKAIGLLNQFFRIIERNGAVADAQIEQLEAELANPITIDNEE